MTKGWRREEIWGVLDLDLAECRRYLRLLNLGGLSVEEIRHLGQECKKREMQLIAVFPNLIERVHSCVPVDRNGPLEISMQEIEAGFASVYLFGSAPLSKYQQARVHIYLRLYRPMLWREVCQDWYENRIQIYQL